MEATDQHEFAHRILMVDGTYRRHLSRAVPVPTDHAVTWFGNTTDVHRRKLAEQDSAEVARLPQQALLPGPLPISNRFVLVVRPGELTGSVGRRRPVLS